MSLLEEVKEQATDYVGKYQLMLEFVVSSPFDTKSCLVPVTVNQVSDQPLLQIGDRGCKVIELQKLLAHWNLYSGAIDGVFGVQLERAVQTFQHRVFLPDDGVVAVSTWRSLYTGAPINMPILQIGSAGRAVVLLQEVLQAVGHATTQPHGNFDQPTETAVRQFQRRQGLVVDGGVGACTWRMLSKSWR